LGTASKSLGKSAEWSGRTTSADFRLWGPDPQFAAMRRSVGNEGEADGRWRAEDACLLRPNGSHVNLFGHLERIIDFDAEVSRSALDFCMAQQ
jgi:hypothetical protein